MDRTGPMERHSDEEKVSIQYKKRHLRAEEATNRDDGDQEDSLIEPPRYTHVHSHLLMYFTFK